MFSFIAGDSKGEKISSVQTESMDSSESSMQDHDYSRNNSSENGLTPNLPLYMPGDDDRESSELHQLPPEGIRLVCRHLPGQALARLEQVSRCRLGTKVVYSWEIRKGYTIVRSREKGYVG